MKGIVTAMVLGLAVFAGASVYDATRPVEHINVKVVVERGDTLQDIICDLQREYGDKRDWREICHAVRKEHGFTKFILPGQELVIPLQIKK